MTDNRFVNNSDVALIMGRSLNGVVTGNEVVQTKGRLFAGIMIDNFNGTQPGKFTGTDISDNRVSCTRSVCDIGINLGPHAWYIPLDENGAEVPTEGGYVTGNIVSGAKQGINVDGADSVDLRANSITGFASRASFQCLTSPRPKTLFTSALNVYTSHSSGVETNGAAFTDTEFSRRCA